MKCIPQGYTCARIDRMDKQATFLVSALVRMLDTTTYVVYTWFGYVGVADPLPGVHACIWEILPEEFPSKQDAITAAKDFVESKFANASEHR